MYVKYDERGSHAQKLKRGLASLGQGFVAQLCWRCDGTTMHKFEHCEICGKGRFYGSALGLLIGNDPAPESVVNQVLVASEAAA